MNPEPDFVRAVAASPGFAAWVDTLGVRDKDYFRELASRYPLAAATAADHAEIGRLIGSISAEPRDTPWMTDGQNARYWSAVAFQNYHWIAMPDAEKAKPRPDLAPVPQ